MMVVGRFTHPIKWLGRFPFILKRPNHLSCGAGIGRPNHFPQSAYNWNKRATQSLSVKVSLVGK
ncbi:MAG: hypothetical protein ACI3X6_07940, partial [Alloprevotella sp.]